MTQGRTSISPEKRPTPLFLFSLPRSGSTLTQRILATSDDIATVSEPWILIPYFYSLRDRGVYAEYNHTSLKLAVDDFCHALPGGRQDYIEELREFALRLYGRATRTDARYFLDKTPRYHLISNEIVETFPDGKHIFLWRNPLAVIASIIETWGGGNWNIYRHKVDLFDGLAALVETYQQNQGSVHSVRYEDLLLDSERAWSGVFDYLELPFDPSALKAFSEVDLKGRKGDHTGTRKYDSVSRKSLDGWRSTLNSPVRKMWCRRYLNWLGSERLAVMGYDLDDLLEQLESLEPSYGRVGYDLWRGLYGVAYDVLEPKILRRKLQMLPAWKEIHAHK